MWYDDIYDDVDLDAVARADAETEAQSDAYWQILEDFWYVTRPHTIDKDFEELNVYELSQLKRNYATHLEDEECRLYPEQYYGVCR